MKKYVIAGVLIAAFVTPAFAEEIYVVFDPASHKCEAMHNIPEGKKCHRVNFWQHGRGQQSHGLNEGMRRIVSPSA